MPSPKRAPFRLLFLFVLVTVFAWACSREHGFLGTYKPIPGSPPEYAGLLVELKKGGEGIRHFQNGESLNFKWVVKGDELRIHTKSGGIIIARPKGDLIEVKFPGPQIVYFKKVK